VNTYLRVRNRLRALGASPQLLVALDLATAADHFLAHAIDAEHDDVQPDDHPLATWVVTRQFHEMLAWPFTKIQPSFLTLVPKVHRRGPVVSSPSLSREEQERFFEHLKAIVEKSLSSRASSSAAVLLRRQAYYWIGESRTAEHSDAFMVKDLHCAAGLTLLRCLEENLRSGELLLDLYVHSIWALLQRRAWLLAYDSALARTLYQRRPYCLSAQTSLLKQNASLKASVTVSR
jgi:hypothetical protein